MSEEKEIFRVIHYKEVLSFFKAIGMIDELEQGKISCNICGVKINSENFGAVTNKSNKLIFCCKSESCIRKFLLTSGRR